MKRFLWIFALLSFALFLPAGNALAKDNDPTKTLPLSIQKGNVFIAVGAGHLVGKDSVIQMLRAKGYKVVRVKGK